MIIIITSNNTAIPGTTALVTIREANDVTALSGTAFVTVSSAPLQIALEAENGDGQLLTHP